MHVERDHADVGVGAGCGATSPVAAGLKKEESRGSTLEFDPPSRSQGVGFKPFVLPYLMRGLLDSQVKRTPYRGECKGGRLYVCAEIQRILDSIPREGT